MIAYKCKNCGMLMYNYNAYRITNRRYRRTCECGGAMYCVYNDYTKYRYIIKNNSCNRISILSPETIIQICRYLRSNIERYQRNRPQAIIDVINLMYYRRFPFSKAQRHLKDAYGYMLWEKVFNRNFHRALRHVIFYNYDKTDVEVLLPAPASIRQSGIISGVCRVSGRNIVEECQRNGWRYYDVH